MNSSTSDDGAFGAAFSPRVLALFMAARFSAISAAQVLAVAVGWYVYALTGSAIDLGLIGLAQFLPTVGLALPAGQIIDRYPRRYVLMAAMGVEGLCALALAALSTMDHVPVIAVFAIVACYGAARAFEYPAFSSLLPGLVPAAEFPRAAAWSSMSNQSAFVIAPALGGLLYVFGATVPFAVAVALLTMAVSLVLFLPASRRPASREPVTLRGVLSGLEFILRNKVVLGAISLDMFGVLFGGAVALLPIFARDILSIGPLGMGLLRSAPAVGGLAIGLVLTRRPPRRHVGVTMLAAVAVFGAATIAFGLSASAPISFAALAVAGAADMVSVVIRSTLVQIWTPDAIRGRVSAVNSLFIGTSNQLGEFESGITAAWFGPVGSVVLGGTATLLIVGFWCFGSPALRKLDRLDGGPAKS
ncbi:MAG: MFS transporter [Alphaproteobacteria bacterium]|nr:MFS transporter [Alphaproteobacteria bacterium]